MGGRWRGTRRMRRKCPAVTPSSVTCGDSFPQRGKPYRRFARYIALPAWLHGRHICRPYKPNRKFFVSIRLRAGHAPPLRGAGFLICGSRKLPPHQSPTVTASPEGEAIQAVYPVYHNVRVIATQKPSPLGGRWRGTRRMRGKCPGVAPSSVTCGDSFPKKGKPYRRCIAAKPPQPKTTACSAVAFSYKSINCPRASGCAWLPRRSLPSSAGWSRGGGNRRSAARC